MLLDYGVITNCKKQDLNLGWTSFDFKAAPMPSADLCKAACNANTACDFYTFVASAPNFKCWCGEYKVPGPVTLPLNQLDSISEVTLNFKKGESFLNFHIS